MIWTGTSMHIYAYLCISMHIYAYLCFPGWVFQATNRKLGSSKVQLDGGLRQDSCSVTWLRWAPHGSAVTWVEWTVPGMYQLDFHDYCFKGLLWLLYMIIQLEKTIISTWLLCFFFGCWFVKTLKKNVHTRTFIFLCLILSPTHGCNCCGEARLNSSLHDPLPLEICMQVRFFLN